MEIILSILYILVIIILLLLIKYPEIKEISNKHQEENILSCKWNKTIKTITKNIEEKSYGKIRVINNIELDRLINVRGKNRPIAVFVKPRSSSLSMSGSFIYDTRKLNDQSLYYFVGPDCPESLINLGEELLELMNKDLPAKNIYKIIKSLEGNEFNKLIYEIGGHRDQIQSKENSGDELFFENTYFKTLLHFNIFNNGEIIHKQIKNPTLEDLPKDKVVIIDPSDIALYLWIPNEQIVKDEVIKWISEQKEFEGRDLVLFNENNIPPNLKILFKKF